MKNELADEVRAELWDVFEDQEFDLYLENSSIESNWNLLESFVEDDAKSVLDAILRTCGGEWLEELVNYFSEGAVAEVKTFVREDVIEEFKQDGDLVLEAKEELLNDVLLQEDVKEELRDECYADVVALLKEDDDIREDAKLELIDEFKCEADFVESFNVVKDLRQELNQLRDALRKSKGK